MLPVTVSRVDYFWKMNTRGTSSTCSISGFNTVITASTPGVFRAVILSDTFIHALFRGSILLLLPILEVFWGSILLNTALLGIFI